MNKKSDVWPVFLRYYTTMERMHRRAIDEWTRVRALRGELAAPANFEIPSIPIAPPPAPTPDTILDPPPPGKAVSAPALTPAVTQPAPGPAEILPGLAILLACLMAPSRRVNRSRLLPSVPIAPSSRRHLKCAPELLKRRAILE